MLARFLSIVLLVVLLVPQVGQAHVHLCFDGAGPAASMHAPAMGEPCIHVDTAGHHDHTVEVDSPAVGKIHPPGLGTVLLAIVPALLDVPRQVGFLPLATDQPSPATSLLHLRPPLRGPPA